jgi:hypothetical protein|nr:MAG TPA: hypothetical protein [Caudoviricetes sp.]
MKKENIEIIKKTYEIIRERYAIHASSMYLECSKIIGLSNEEHQKINYKLRAIRQDFTKILIMMNRIEKAYLEYQKNIYIANYTNINNSEAQDELGCVIEYLFAKYRVIIEYIYQILEIFIPPRFSEEKREEYMTLKKWHKKHKFLIEYIKSVIGDKNNLINMEWFQQIRIDRDFIIHDGATCLVFGDKERLLFKVMEVDALDKEEEKEEIQDDFFLTDNNLIVYTYFWGLQISKLIIFCEIIFEFLSNDSETRKDSDVFLEKIYEKGTLIDSNNKEISELQDVLIRLLQKIIDEKN